jgi:hypothetical protein
LASVSANLTSNEVAHCEMDYEMVTSVNVETRRCPFSDDEIERADLQRVSERPSSPSTNVGVEFACEEFDIFSEKIYFDDDGDDDSDAVDSDDYDEDKLSWKQLPLAAQLADWAIQNSITHAALSSLLAILHPYHDRLPQDARTLLKTPRNYEIRNLLNNEGQYYHFGIEHGISLCLGQMANPDSLGTLSVQFNVDGLPLFKSSSTEFWPILGLIKDSCAKPFVIGLYFGKGKPVDVSDFLKDFLNELQHLLSNGFKYQNTVIKVVVDCFICDAPARAYLKNSKSHCAYFGCDKCKQEGEYVHGRMTFPELSASLRTDAEFLAMSDEEHHRGTTPLSQVPLRLVTDFVLDYMHSVCLGVVRRTINFWLKGPVGTGIRLQSRSVQLLSDRLKSLANAIPREFGRRPRSLSEVDRWKAQSSFDISCPFKWTYILHW